jgi:hypothetical protein
LNVKSESDIHLGAKNQIKEELSHTNTLSIARVCTTKQDLEHIAIAPFWTCSHMLVEKDWLKGFNKAETEYRMKRIGIPDVALLDRDTDKVIGLVEVLYTSKMSNTKISMLNKSEIPWVETKAEDVMGWTGADPLIAYRSSEPDWQCNACKDINWQHVTLERIAAIVDVYPKAGWSTKFYRKVFAIFQDIRALPNNAEELVDRYYLVEGTYMVLDGWNIIECESFLRGAVQFSESYEKIIGKEPIFLDGLHFALNEDQAMILLQDLMTTSLNTWKQSPTRYSIDDQALKWPGMSLRQIFHQKDSKGTLSKVVNVQNYQSLPTLYPTIARLFGYNIPWLKGNTSNSNKPLKKLVQK